MLLKKRGKFVKKIAIFNHKGACRKYHGLDSGRDFYNSVHPWISTARFEQKEIFKVLGIECRAGMPILEIKNKAYAAGSGRILCNAFTTNAKYYEDLLSVCDNVCCDSNENRIDSIFKGNYDFIVIEKEINRFERPFDVLNFALTHASGGQVLIRIKNMLDIGVLASCLGGTHPIKLDGFHYINLKDVIDFIMQYQVINVKIMSEKIQALQEMVDRLLSEHRICEFVVGDVETVKQNLETFRHWILVSV